MVLSFGHSSTLPKLLLLLLCLILMSKGTGQLEPGDRFPLTWVQLEERAKSKEWTDLGQELKLKLSEEETKSQRMGIPIDFQELGFKILRISAEIDPSGPIESRVSQLEAHAARLLGERHPALSYVMRCSEQLQALIAINTSPAWAELASVFRVDLERPEWALEAADISLQKDSKNVAALTAKVASHGDLGDFELAHKSYKLAKSLDPKSAYLSAAIAKVRFRERKFDEAMNDAMAAFCAKPHAATARLVANIYKGAGIEKRARSWYQEAESIEGSDDDKVTQAHIEGLLLLAKAAMTDFKLRVKQT